MSKKDDKLRVMLFEHVLIGQLFKQDGDYPDVFLRIPERRDALICKCGVGMNSVNLNAEGPFIVHFCPGTKIKFSPYGARLGECVVLKDL